MFRKKVLDREMKSVKVEALGESLEVREMSVRERVAAFADARDGEQLDPALLCCTVLVRSVFQDGKRVFEDEDAFAIADAPFEKELDQLASKALNVNGLSGEAREKAEGN